MSRADGHELYKGIIWCGTCRGGPMAPAADMDAAAAAYADPAAQLAAQAAVSAHPTAAEAAAAAAAGDAAAADGAAGGEGPPPTAPIQLSGFSGSGDAAVLVQAPTGSQTPRRRVPISKMTL
jgi:hypothetical protein